MGFMEANEQLGAEVVRLRAELARFRPVTITEMLDVGPGLNEVVSIVNGLIKIDGKWATVPLEVYLKDEPPTP
jgi:hypothetical protein